VRWREIRVTVGFVALHLLLALPAAVATALPAVAEIDGYLVRVKGLVDQLPAPPGDDGEIRGYLTGCVERASFLRDLAASPATEQSLLFVELKRFTAFRNTAKDGLGSLTPLGRSLLRAENGEAWPALGHYLMDDYVRGLVIRKALYERKYFEEDDPKQANLLEGWLNSRFDFCRTRDGAQAWYRRDGVSAFEVTVRTEPVVLVTRSTDVAVVLAGGLLYNFLPAVGQDAGDPFRAAVHDDLLSRQVKRVGLRAAAGAVFDGAGPDLLVGAGVQVRAISLWATYQPEETAWSLAVGVSDWRWLKRLRPILPYFGGL